jgi:signal transduction histidine kinase
MNNFLFYSNKLLPRVLFRILPITIIVFMMIGYFAINIINNTILNAHQSRLDKIAAQSSSIVALRFQSILDTASDLAANDLIINSIIDAEQRDQYIPTLFQSIRVLGSAEVHVTLADYRGRKIASNKNAVDHKDEPWVDVVMQGEKVVQIDANGMFVAVPVLIRGLPEGIIVIEYDALQLDGLLSFPIQADAYTVGTSDGKIIYSSNADFAKVTNIDHDHTDGEAWVHSEVAVLGFEKLKLYAGDIRSSVLAPVERQKFVLFMVFLASVISVAAGIVATGVITVKPVTKFIDGVKQVSTSTDLTFRMQSNDIYEFNQLATGFNTMLSNLESTTSSRDYVDSILNSMNEFMLVISQDGTVISGNLAIANFLRCDVDELVGLDVKSLFSQNWEELVILPSAENSNIESVLTNSFGRKIPVLIFASMLGAGSENLNELIFVFSDITEQLAAKAELDRSVVELRRSNSDLEQFAYVASHDLKAPLKAIDNLAAWIEEDSAEHMSAQSQSDMKTLRERINRLDALLAGLLQYAKTGKSKMPVVQIDTHDLVEGVAELLSPVPAMKINVSKSMPNIPTHRVPLEQIFQNLISNAIRHHDKESGVIEVGGRDFGPFVEFFVTDDGPGISPQYHEKIFQMFQTLKRRDEVESSGIGLAVVQKLVDAYGGYARVESVVGQRGTTFKFSWPKQKIHEE